MTVVRGRARAELEALGREVSGRRRRRGPRRAPRHPKRRWIVGVLVAVLVLVAGWVVAFSPLLAVSGVTVKGVHRLTGAQVITQAQVRHGVPLVRVARGAIERRVEKLPDVLSASVSVSLPSTVVITVTERTAAGVLELDANSWALVDETGHRFNTVTVKPANLPVLQPAPSVAGDPATLAAMAQVAVSVPPAVRATIAQVTATGTQDVTLVLSDARRVVWGASERNAEKARVLTALLARPGMIYNITNPDLPYISAG